MLGERIVYKFNLSKTYSIGSHNDYYEYKFNYQKSTAIPKSPLHSIKITYEQQLETPINNKRVIRSPINKFKSNDYKNILSAATLFMPLLLNRNPNVETLETSEQCVASTEVSKFSLKLKKL